MKENRSSIGQTLELFGSTLFLMLFFFAPIFTHEGLEWRMYGKDESVPGETLTLFDYFANTDNTFYEVMGWLIPLAMLVNIILLQRRHPSLLTFLIRGAVLYSCYVARDYASAAIVMMKNAHLTNFYTIYVYLSYFMLAVSGCSMLCFLWRLRSKNKQPLEQTSEISTDNNTEDVVIEKPVKQKIEKEPKRPKAPMSKKKKKLLCLFAFLPLSILAIVYLAMAYGKQSVQVTDTAVCEVKGDVCEVETHIQAADKQLLLSDKKV